MSEMTAFTIEGNIELEHDTDSGSKVKIDGECLSCIIANNFDFPNENEWDAMFQHLESLREQGMQPLDGEPDVVRQGPKVRVTVELVE